MTLRGRQLPPPLYFYFINNLSRKGPKIRKRLSLRPQFCKNACSMKTPLFNRIIALITALLIPLNGIAFADVLIDLDITEIALKSLHVDKNGLNRMDKRILTCIIDKFNGGPVGLTTISTAVAEEAETLEEVIEPFLIQQGYLERTPRGRQVTKKAYDYFKKPFPGKQTSIF